MKFRVGAPSPVLAISVRQSPVSKLLLLVFVEILPDKVILDQKVSFLVYFKNFLFVIFSLLLKIETNENFQN